MDLIHWEQEHGSDRVDDYGFFDRPLARPTLFHFKTRRMEVAPHGGAYSLKFTLGGRETYAFGRRRLALLPGEMLLVEQGRSYGSDISEPTESLSLFLPDAWVLETSAGLGQGDGAILDEPQAALTTSLPLVPSRLSAPGQANLLALKGKDSAAVAEASLALLAEALHQLPSLKHRYNRLVDMRAGTRDEILTRLRRAHDRIADRHGLGLDLDQLSRTACLSRFHFLRLFKQAYGQTPLRLAAAMRLRRALDLAAGGDLAGALKAGGFGSAAALRRALRRESRP